MGVINFAHASFYMLGAYAAYSITPAVGFWWALLLAPLLVGVGGALFEAFCLRRVHAHGHVAELLVTFGLAYIVLELVQLVWGRSSVPLDLPQSLQGPLFGWFGVQFPRGRAFAMLVSVSILALLWLVLQRTRLGLVVQASITHPEMAQALGHNVPRVFMLVFAGGSALAALAGVLGGSLYITEPGMAMAVGSIIFVVVVVGGLGSLQGAFWASMGIGLLQTLAASINFSLLDAARWAGVPVEMAGWAIPLWRMSVAQLAPALPYLLMIVMLALRPRGLMGKRES